jgi:uncharacterized phage-associated protein
MAHQQGIVQLPTLTLAVSCRNLHPGNVMFNERKAAQIAVWFLRQSGGQMPHLKLMKLMYLADREALREYGFPISGDRVVAMPHGPVLSLTLYYLDGNMRSGPDGWEAWISDRADHEVGLCDRKPGDDALDELSPAETDVMARVWAKFGRMSKWEIRDYTYDHCAEWTDPKGSSLPIEFRHIFLAIGRSEADAARLAAQLEEQRVIERSFATA